MPKMRFLLPLLAVMLLLPSAAFAAHGHPTFPKDLELYWVIPFVCMLLSIAIGPLAVPHFWHHHFGKVALFWGLAFLVPATFILGFDLVSFYAVET
ncbi:MAG: sodium:proton antiporter, partial [Mailhella sp.]|nr:sodium:proton antiporter [Mailhella sp.]